MIPKTIRTEDGKIIATFLKHKAAFRDEKKMSMTFWRDCKIVQEGKYEVDGHNIEVWFEEDGYPYIEIDGGDDVILTLRECIAELTHNNEEEIGPVGVVRDICDNKACCRPSHLYIDYRRGAGIKDPEEKREIYKTYMLWKNGDRKNGQSMDKIAKRKGVSKTTIGNIIKEQKKLEETRERNKEQEEK